MVAINPEHSIVVIDPAQAVTDARTRKDVVVQLQRDNILRAGVDFGIIPGTAKPTLYKPGAERLCAAFHFDPRFETLTVVERWDGSDPLFFYRIMCRLVHIETGMEIATGIGSCNSREVKYRWRWVNESDIPAHLDRAALLSRNALLSEPSFAIDKGETGGKYGKPVEYWQRFREAIAAGTARPNKRKTAKGGEMDVWEIGGIEYRIPNDDIFSLVNTIDKMACKRALIAATLIGANASEFFTQDIEDMPGFGVSADGDVIEGVYTEAPKRWTEEESQAWVDGKTADGFSSADIRAALGVKDRKDFAGDKATADALFADWLERQVVGSGK